MKYLVTGGAGFIGSHIARTLLEQGQTVRIMDNFSTGKRENIVVLTQQFGRDQLEIMEGDVRDASRVKEAVAGIEIIFHEAAFVSVPQSMQEPQECFDINLTGTFITANAAARHMLAHGGGSIVLIASVGGAGGGSGGAARLGPGGESHSS